MSEIAANTQIEVLASGVDESTAVVLKTSFVPFLQQAEEWRVKVAEVTDPKVARASRLTLKKIRCKAEEDRQRREAEEAARAAAAPDKEKLHRLAEMVGTLEVPDLTTAGGKRAAREIAMQIKQLEQFIIAQAGKL